MKNPFAVANLAAVVVAEFVQLPGAFLPTPKLASFGAPMGGNREEATWPSRRSL